MNLRRVLQSIIYVVGPVVIAQSGVAGQGGATGSPAKVESTVLAPAEKGVQFYVSPRGSHFLAVTQRGSRFVVLHDGVEGPRFDEIGRGGDSSRHVAFSDDGARYAYLARSGQEFVLMVDGTEMLPACGGRRRSARRRIGGGADGRGRRLVGGRRPAPGQ